MALKFNKVAGEAKKSEVTYFKFKEGENHFRMFGDILPRYVYWLKSADGSKTFAMECLGFDRDEEKFTNKEADYIAKEFPDMKCSWSYVVNVIDLEDGTTKVVTLKKKMFAAILEMAERHLGDPTDLEEGWDVVVTRKKTGPLNYNVEYTLDQLACKKRAVTDAERELIENSKSIDELFPRQTAEEQKSFIESQYSSSTEVEETEDDIPDDFDDDIAY